ncbi:MAG: hypothetical protein P8N02_01785 [Actinomycetota bacterium]|nr:hypothetical protein [Actinomycetota bacterium]
MSSEEIEQLVDHALGRDDGRPVSDQLSAEVGTLRETVGRLEHAEVTELSAPVPPPDLLDRIHAATGPAPAHTQRRLSPSWLGRWTPAVAAAMIAVVVAVVSLWPSTDEFIEFELATHNGAEIVAEFRVEEADATTGFEVRTTGLQDVEYDVWVRTAADGERHWIGAFNGDTDGAERFVADFTIADIERLWVTDPDNELILGHDLDQ